MAIHDGQPIRPIRRLLPYQGSLLAIAVLMSIVPAAALAQRQSVVAGSNPNDSAGGFCTATSQRQAAACGYKVDQQLFNARALCLNLANGKEREDCYTRAEARRIESGELCGAQTVAREALCSVLGESRYDPSFNPADFDNDFHHLTRPNPYQPLGIGYQWQYAGGDEIIAIEILDRTKLIKGVTCIEARDQVWENGKLLEDTFDWFGQAKNGDVYYCGEETKEYKVFAGDKPRKPELVNTDGSFKWGRSGDKGGIVSHYTPHEGMTYRQEFSPDNAEDAATVLAAHYRYGSDPNLDRFMPPKLGRLFCSHHDCVVTAEVTPIEPDALEYKYYAVGIGVILEATPDTGETTQLMGCNFDPRCEGLDALM